MEIRSHSIPFALALSLLLSTVTSAQEYDLGALKWRNIGPNLQAIPSCQAVSSVLPSAEWMES